MKNFYSKFIGDKAFYKKILIVSVPIMLQNGITNFVGFLDNIMIGQLGTNQMSGVSIINQLFFVFALCIFGAVSGVGIFTSQFFGQGNTKGVQETFRFKHYLVLIITIIGILLFFIFGDSFIQLFLHEGSNSGDIPKTLAYAKDYLCILLFGFIPYAISQVYASTLRETGKTMLPMIASSIAVLINLVLNYLLIFGKFGFPELGVRGAAIATVIARVVEVLIIVFWVHLHTHTHPFILRIYRSLEIPKQLAWQIAKKGLPLFINEGFWALGMTALLQSYSMRGLAVVGGLNISNTINNVFNIVFIALGNTLAIIVGQLLGANKMEEAVDSDRKIIAFSVITCIFVGIILIFTAPIFPKFYNTTEEVRALATTFIRTTGFLMPLYGFLHSTYFTLRSGGKTLITFLFDSVFVWTIAIPTAYLLIRFTTLPITHIFIIVGLTDIIKCVIGFIFVKKKIWVQNIVS